MSLLLDEGENQLVVMRGRQTGPTTYDDLVDHRRRRDLRARARRRPRPAEDPYADLDATATAPAPRLPPLSREWYVALALAEPWLTGTDDYPRPPSNREIYERVLGWHGYAWNLERAQRVDDAIRSISALAFGAQGRPVQRRPRPRPERPLRHRAAHRRGPPGDRRRPRGGRAGRRGPEGSTGRLLAGRPGARLRSQHDPQSRLTSRRAPWRTTCRAWTPRTARRRPTRWTPTPAVVGDVCAKLLARVQATSWIGPDKNRIQDDIGGQFIPNANAACEDIKQQASYLIAKADQQDAVSS